jgi:hypothetical protein
MCNLGTSQSKTPYDDTCSIHMLFMEECPLLKFATANTVQASSLEVKMKAALLKRQDDFAQMRIRGHIPLGFQRFVKREGPVDERA